MSRPIDADRLKKQFPNMQKGFEHQIKEGYFSPQYVALMIDEAPTLEIPKVTQCYECKDWHGDSDGWGMCSMLGREVEQYFYCGYGKKGNG